MIQKIKTAWKCTDNTIFESLESAKVHEIELIMREDGGIPLKSVDEMVPWILSRKDKILDVWTTNPASRPRARKINKKKSEAEA